MIDQRTLIAYLHKFGPFCLIMQIAILIHVQNFGVGQLKYDMGCTLTMILFFAWF
jgi:hypothetical protein